MGRMDLKSIAGCINLRTLTRIRRGSGLLSFWFMEVLNVSGK